MIPDYWKDLLNSREKQNERLRFNFIMDKITNLEPTHNVNCTIHILDKEGLSLDNVQVKLEGNGITYTSTSTYGVSYISNVLTGDYILTCSLNGYDTYTTNIHVSKNTNVFNITMDESRTTADLSFKVTDQVTGEPLKESILTLMNTETLYRTSTDEEGTGIIKDVVFDDYLLTCVNIEHKDYSSNIQVSEDSCFSISLIPQDYVNVKLGFVNNTFTPLKPLNISLTSPDHSFDLTDITTYPYLTIPRGTYDLSIRSEYYKPYQCSVSLDNEENNYLVALEGA